MRWVIEVRPFRLLVDCMAACESACQRTYFAYKGSGAGGERTDSAAASSSASLGRLWPLWGLRNGWLFLAADIGLRDVAPDPKLPEPPLRLCGWLSKDAEEFGWDCEGEGVWEGGLEPFDVTIWVIGLDMVVSVQCSFKWRFCELEVQKLPVEALNRSSVLGRYDTKTIGARRANPGWAGERGIGDSTRR